MAKKGFKFIQKLEQSAGLVGKVFDSFTSNSTIDAPSIHIVKTELDKKATNDTVNALTSRVSTAETDISTIENKMTNHHSIFYGTDQPSQEIIGQMQEGDIYIMYETE